MRYPSEALRQFARDLLIGARLEQARASVVADVLLEGDLLGHDTHGLALLAPYLRELDAGTMTRTGQHRVVEERAASALWDGRRLPGPWLTRLAIDDAIERAQHCGTGTVVIRRSHHIACLAAYLSDATDRGFVLLLSCSDPNAASVAPFGGTQAVFTPDPIAFGFPTAGDPVLIDLSASLTTNGMTARLHKSGQRLAHPWLLTADGVATDDPTVLFSEPRGTILPAGGIDAGHKGYALALIVEVLTGGLAGHGRAEPREGWGATVFVQAIDPSAFGGRDAFARQAEWIAHACRNNSPRPGSEAVRMPGERGLARRRDQLANGVALHADILPTLKEWSTRLSVPMPVSMPAAH
ncbi:MAG TPA: Ldh family oxidoreductase [Burkholderiaceae bacterium]|nr:Ldh family oxidoreductase [Burkholderiaceae bacterium]